MSENNLEITEEYISLEEWARIVAHAWRDEKFKNEFELHPRKAIEDFIKSCENILELPNVTDEENDHKLKMNELFQKVRFKRFFEIPPCPTTITEEQIDGILSKDKEKQTPVIPYLTI
jgi:hypothetical protein